MNQMQKESWYTLIVVILTASVYLIFFHLFGPRKACAAFAILALLGFRSSFYKKEKGVVLADERDREIAQKAVLTGYFVFCFYFVAAGAAILLWLDIKDISKHMFITFLLFGAILFLAAKSVATLILYRSDIQESINLLEAYRSMTDLQKGSLKSLVITAFVITGFILIFPLGKPDHLPAFGILLCLVFAFIFSRRKKAYRNLDLDEWEERVVNRAHRIAVLSFGISLIFGLLILGVLYILWGKGIISLDRFLLIIFCSFAAGLLTQHAVILALYSRGPEEITDAEK